MAENDSNRLKLFISYSTRHRPDIVESIRMELNATERYKIWKDQCKLKGGSKYFQEISKAIMNTNFFLCFLSNEYFKSKVCQDELSLAYGEDKKIIPILLEEILPKYPPEDFALMLKHIQYIIVGKKSCKDVCKEIVESINSALSSGCSSDEDNKNEEEEDKSDEDEEDYSDDDDDDGENKLEAVHTELYGSDQYCRDTIHFTDSIPTNSHMSVRKVMINSGLVVDSIRLMLSDSINSYYTEKHGGNGGNCRTWTVPENEYISKIELYVDDILYSITFITNQGNRSPTFGAKEGTRHIVSLNGSLVGVYGFAAFYENIQVGNENPFVISQIGFLTI